MDGDRRAVAPCFVVAEYEDDVVRLGGGGVEGAGVRGAEERRQHVGADDVEAIDALCKALERARRFEELVAALERRAELSEDEDAARSDRTRAAQLLSRALDDRPRAIAAFRRVRQLHGRSPELFESLKEMHKLTGGKPN